MAIFERLPPSPTLGSLMHVMDVLRNFGAHKAANQRLLGSLPTMEINQSLIW
jgi:hypothetical protein